MKKRVSEDKTWNTLKLKFVTIHVAETGHFIDQINLDTTDDTRR